MNYWKNHKAILNKVDDTNSSEVLKLSFFNSYWNILNKYLILKKTIFLFTAG